MPSPDSGKQSPRRPHSPPELWRLPSHSINSKHHGKFPSVRSALAGPGGAENGSCICKRLCCLLYDISIACRMRIFNFKLQAVGFGPAESCWWKQDNNTLNLVGSGVGCKRNEVWRQGEGKLATPVVGGLNLNPRRGCRRAAFRVGPANRHRCP